MGGGGYDGYGVFTFENTAKTKKVSAKHIFLERRLYTSFVHVSDSALSDVGKEEPVCSIP